MAGSGLTLAAPDIRPKFPQDYRDPLSAAVGGLVLAAGTDTGHLFPTDSAYTTASLIGVAAMAVTAMTSIALARQRAPQRQSAQERTEPKST